MTTLHLVSHTHWDREWYQTYQQFRLKLVHLVDLLLDILDKDPNYRHFMLDGQTIVLADYLQIRPEREEDLRRYIQNGRILIGPWYILPDEFLVSPEATVRNLLEGDRDARKYGPKMTVGYIPDPFGHIGQMPQILRGFGIETASVMRGLADEPCEFWWQGPDGSRVLMAYLRASYGNAAGILSTGLDAFVGEAKRLRNELGAHAASPHVLLMHGVDHMEPQWETSQAIAYANLRLDGDQMVHSTLPAYLAEVQAALAGVDLPVVTGELRSSKRFPLLPGVLSARMWIKQRNQQCETLLERWADPFSTWAGLLPLETAPAGTLRAPKAALREAWRLLMLCHPHDSICGCSIDQVHDEMRPRFDQVEQIGEVIAGQSLERLAAAVDSEAIDTAAPAVQAGLAPRGAIVVFNATGGPRTGLVSATVEAPPDGQEVELVDQAGQPVPFQALGQGTSELFNMIMGRKEIRDGFNMISNGEVMGMRITGFSLRREGNQAFVEMVMSENGEVNLEAWEEGRRAMEAYLADPALTSYQIRARSAMSVQLMFVAAEVPGFGYRTFWVRGRRTEGKLPIQLSSLARMAMPVVARLGKNQAFQGLVRRLAPDPAEKGPFRIENDHLVVEAAPDGTLTLTDKRTGTGYAGLNRFMDGGDRGDEYNYSKPEVDLLVSSRLERARVERGPARQMLELWLALDIPLELSSDRRARAKKSVRMPVYTRITLAHGSPVVEIHSEVDNQARDHRLRVHFPAPFRAEDAEYDGHFEVVRRPVGLPAFDEEWVEQPRPEVPQRAFTYITDGQAALAVANRGLPEVEVLQRGDGRAEIALTLMRCVGWLSRGDLPERPGNAGPSELTPGAQMPGKWSFDYAVIPGRAEERLDLFAQAYAFETPMRAVSVAVRSGQLPPQGGFLHVNPQEFVLSTVKVAEDGRGWLVRGVNLSSDAVTVVLETLFEIRSAEKTTLMESKLADLVVDGRHRVNLQAGPHEVVTVRLM